jgi:hypothetical protein
MKTEDLIAALAADSTPAPRPEQGLPVAAGALAVAGASLFLILGLRDDLGAALAPFTLPKTLLPLALGVLALVLALRSARPGAARGRLPVAMLGIPAVAALLAGLRLFTSEPAGWAMQVTGKTMIPCLVTIPLTAALPLGALLWLLRRGAPLAPWLTGLAAGLTAGGFAAALYSLYCTEDSPLFWALWYSTAIGITATVGAVLGHRLLRW